MLERIFGRRQLPAEGRMFAIYYGLPEGLPERDNRVGSTRRKISAEELKIPKKAQGFLFLDTEMESEEVLVKASVDGVTCISISFGERRVNYLYVEETFVEVLELVQESEIKVCDDGDFDHLAFDKLLTSLEEHLEIS